MLCMREGGKQEEVVVKLRAGYESSLTGVTCELLASLFASDLDLPVPAPFLVEIPTSFYQGVPELALADRFKNSGGLNFGSQFLSSGYVTWPQERSIPAALQQDAAEIFAFDLMIQNPDRRKDKPNLLRKGDDIAIIDHEMAFSFLYSVLPEEYPWLGKGMGFAGNHLFHAGLKGKKVALDRLHGALEAVDDRRLEAYGHAVPSDWRKGEKDATVRILKYIQEVRANSSVLFRKIKEVLT
jgi:hypothetical protein